MKQINLLPDSYKNKLRLERIFKGVIVIQAIALFLSILFAVIFGILSDELYKKSAIYSEYIAASKYLEPERIIDEVMNISNRIENLERLEASIELPHSITDKDVRYVFSLLPQGVFVNTISFNEGASKVIFDGLSESRDNIVEFVEALADTGNFAEIVTKTMTLKDNGKMVSFTLDIYYLKEGVQ